MRPRRVRVIHQTDDSDSGAACLAMIATAFGMRLTLVQARYMCGVSRSGTTVRAIAAAARSVGLDAHGVELEAQPVEALLLPAILHCKDNHFVVLESVRREDITVIDPNPEVSAQRRSHAWLRDFFSGTAIAFEGAAERKREPMAGLRGLRTSIPEGVSLRFVAYVASTATLQLLAAAAPLMAGTLVNHVAAPLAPHIAAMVASALLAAICARAALRWMSGTVLFAGQATTDLRMVHRRLEHLAVVDTRIFSEWTAGEILNRVDAGYAVRVVLVAACELVSSVVAIIVYAVLLLAQGATLMLIILASASLRLLLGFRGYRRMTDYARQEAHHHAAELAVATAGLAMPEQLASPLIATAVLARYRKEVGGRLTATVRVSNVIHGAEFLTRGVDAIEYAALILVGGAAVCEGRSALGALFGILLLRGLVARQVDVVATQIRRLVYTQPTLARSRDLLVWPRERSGGRPVAAIRAVGYDSIWFRYGDAEPWLLRDCSFRVEPGEFVALTGPSGGGKSTLLKLLLGMHAPTRGRVLVDGHDHAELDLSAVRRQIGYVVQDPSFMNDTILANIACGAGTCPEDIRWACAVSEIWDDIGSLPLGLHTRISADCRELSGGQRQRLSLARALARKPPLLLIDEGTSALDPELEMTVLRNLRATGCTILAVAHREAALRLADRIVTLDAGHTRPMPLAVAPAPPSCGVAVREPKRAAQ